MGLWTLPTPERRSAAMLPPSSSASSPSAISAMRSAPRPSRACCAPTPAYAFALPTPAPAAPQARRLSQPRRIQLGAPGAGPLAWTNTAGMVQLTSVTDAYNRAINYRYHGSEFGYRLRAVEHFLGRKLHFH